MLFFNTIENLTFNKLVTDLKCYTNLEFKVYSEIFYNVFIKIIINYLSAQIKAKMIMKI